MFVHFKTQGLILKKEDRGEADQIFTIFTKDFGRLEILGKGIRKIFSKLRPAMEIFYLSEVEFIQGKTYKTLTDAIVIEKFKNLRKSLKRLAIAYHISDVIVSLIKAEEKDEKIWNLMLETFKNLNNPNLQFAVCNLQYYYFFWNLISYLGHRPELYFCLLCQRKLKQKSHYFSSKEGGVICESCFRKNINGKKIKSSTIKILRTMFEKNFDFFKRLKIKKDDFENLKEISENYLQFLTEKNYETKNF